MYVSITSHGAGQLRKMHDFTEAICDFFFIDFTLKRPNTA
jgi:hypothetical protein